MRSGFPLELISPLPTGLGVGAREVLVRRPPPTPGKGVGKATSSDLTVTTAKDNILDGLHVEMSTSELIPWLKSLLKLRGAWEELSENRSWATSDSAFTVLTQALSV